MSLIFHNHYADFKFKVYGENPLITSHVSFNVVVIQVKFFLVHAMKANRESRSIASLLHPTLNGGE
jgi:hypothetical protein